MLTHGCWFWVSKSFIFSPPALQDSTVQSCAQTVWRTAAATPKTPTTWRTGTAPLEAWSTSSTLTFTRGSSMTRGRTHRCSAMGHPTGSERTLKNFQEATIRYNMIEKVRLKCHEGKFTCTTSAHKAIPVTETLFIFKAQEWDLGSIVKTNSFKHDCWWIGLLQHLTVYHSCTPSVYLPGNTVQQHWALTAAAARLGLFWDSAPLARSNTSGIGLQIPILTSTCQHSPVHTFHCICIL